MQELELNYPTTKGKVYSEEEDRYLLCRLNYYGMRADDVYERIKKDITEFPVFRFDWFFKSRSPQELQRRCNTLLGMIEKEAEAKQIEEIKTKGTKSKVCVLYGHRSSQSSLVSIEALYRRNTKVREGILTSVYPNRRHSFSSEKAAQEEESIDYLYPSEHRIDIYSVIT